MAQLLQSPILLVQDPALQAIICKLKTLGIKGSVTTVHTGPTVSTALFTPEGRTCIGELQHVTQDLSIAARGQVRIFPATDEGAIGIEYPNSNRQIVNYAGLASCREVQAIPRSQRLTVPLGVDTHGKPVLVDLTQLPNLLVAGTTGSGKSMLLHSIILSLLARNEPGQLELVLIDPKMVELTPYRKLHNYLRDFVTDSAEALETLEDLALEVEERYEEMAEAGVRKASALGLSNIVVVIDELADLTTSSADRKAFERVLRKLTGKARAAGVYLIVATQRPSVNVVTGVVKANLPARLTFRLPSIFDSRTVINEGGAENLLGSGDGLFRGAGIQVRLQCAYVSDRHIANAVANHAPPPEPEPQPQGWRVAQWITRVLEWWKRTAWGTDQTAIA